jgi:hypothetical protein
MTDNHNYETPQKGATEWHESLNRNFRYIDRDIEIRDIDAAKTDYRPKSGAKFLATDTEKVYVGDGSRWLRLATSGENPSFETVSAKTIVDRSSGNGYSVDQLAAGSGSGSVEPPVDAVVTLDGGTPTAYRADGSEIARDSDAGALMNSAIDDVASNGGGVVHIDSGMYQSNTKIQVQSNVTVRGAGRGNTVFKATAPKTGWASASNPVRNVTIRDLTVDGDLQGGRTGINLVNCVDSLIQNVEVRNCGGTPDYPDTIPSLRISGGLRSNIVNCHVENSSAVSIEAAIGAEQCSIINCSITGGRREGNAGFLHGYSIEKSNSCAILGCTADSSNESSFNSFRPALNANNANYAVVANNRVIDAAGALFNVNGDCYNNIYAGNTFEDSGPIKVGRGNAGEPHGTIVANNVLRGGQAELGATDLVVQNNLFVNADIILKSMTNAPSVVGNHFYDHSGDTNLVRMESVDDESVVLFANNFAQHNTTTRETSPIYRFRPQYGVLTGNAFGTVGGSGHAKPPVIMEGDRWLVINNYFRGPTEYDNASIKMCDGRLANNVFEGTRFISTVDNKTPIIEGNTYLDEKPVIKGSPANFTLTEPRAETYTGDGTADRFIQTFSNPEHVIIEDGNETKYDVHAQFGTGYQHNAASGELLLTDGGFTVGGSGGDTNLNSVGKKYTFYAR